MTGIYRIVFKSSYLQLYPFYRLVAASTSVGGEVALSAGRWATSFAPAAARAGGVVPLPEMGGVVTGAGIGSMGLGLLCPC